MARPKEFEDSIQRSIYMTEEEMEYIKSRGYKFAEVFRQGLKALKKKHWEYTRK